MTEELSQSVWLYRRASDLYKRVSDSVLLIREESSDVCSLLVYWHGIEALTNEFPSVADCMMHQAEIENVVPS